MAQGVSFEEPIIGGPSAASSPYPPAPAAAALSTWPYFQQYPPQFPGACGTPYPALYQAAQPAGGVSWAGYTGPVSSSAQAAGFTAPHTSPSAPAAQLVRAKSELGTKKGDKEKFSSQPQHSWVTGTDCAAVPVAEVRQPPCGCANHHGLHYKPGLHATWDCPLRYWHKYGCCPGFLPNGNRDPLQWLPGDILTRAAKDAWLALISDKDLQLPFGKDARAPPFHL